MCLQTATWPEVEAYLEKSKGIIVHIGSTEQHGPNGMLGTDAICPETIAFGVAESIEVWLHQPCQSVRRTITSVFRERSRYGPAPCSR